MPPLSNIQLGKSGVTENFIETLKTHFKKHQNVKVSILKSACRDRDELKEINEKILEGLGAKYTSKVIGYTLVIKKWRKEMR